MKNRVYQKANSEERAKFKALPGEEKEECCKCGHGEPPENHARIQKGDFFVTTKYVCSKCGCDEFYLYKEKQLEVKNK